MSEQVPSKELCDRLRFTWADNGSGYNSDFTADLSAAADEIERLQRQKDNLLETVNSKQAKIDALMLEFCPGEMSAEQRAVWAKAQQSAPEPGVEAAQISNADLAIQNFELSCKVRLLELEISGPRASKPPRDGQ